MLWTSSLSTPHLVNIMISNNSIKQSVKVIQEVNYFDRFTEGWNGCEAHDVTEVDGDLVKILRLHSATSLEGFCHWSEMITQRRWQGKRPCSTPKSSDTLVCLKDLPINWRIFTAVISTDESFLLWLKGACQNQWSALQLAQQWGTLLPNPAMYCQSTLCHLKQQYLRRKHLR